ncbi:MAG: hypothetical protein OXQ31_17525 [Spirochaetaceae bacterium]|nr:hypothetical protein [Spirochaetaceae bacterium]
MDRDLAESPRIMDRSIVFDLGASVGTDIGADKDRMVAEAFGSAKRNRSA